MEFEILPAPTPTPLPTPTPTATPTATPTPTPTATPNPDVDGTILSDGSEYFSGLDFVGDVDTWVFNLTDNNETITISVNALDFNIDPYIELVSPSGIMIASDDDSGGSLNAKISDLVIMEPGQYTIYVKTQSWLGQYSIRLDLN